MTRKKNRQPLSAKKSMFYIWAVASVLWLAFCVYMYDLGKVGYAYSQYERYSSKVAQGRSADPFHWDYHKRQYQKARKNLDDVNRNISLFFLVGIGFPGIMLAVGTIALGNIDKPGKREKT